MKSKHHVFPFSAAVVFLFLGCFAEKISADQSSKDNLVASINIEASSELEPQLSIVSGNQKVIFRRSDLLKIAELQVLKLEKDPVYKGKMTSYTAVPLKKLFENIKFENNSTLLFNCLDGFSAPISIERTLLQGSESSQAYVAIELEGEKWPSMKANREVTAGPFYLVWMNPEKSKIGPEEWPYQLSGFEVVPPIEEQYPALVPENNISKKSKVYSGFQLYLKNCLSCHKINQQGPSELGPDLNSPYNPTEYLNEKYLKIWIRNPQDLRHWSGSKMTGFDKSSLSDTELNQIIAYLKYISKHKK